jgi:hypothetical protein
MSNGTTLEPSPPEIAMTLGPVNNNSNRLSQLRQTEIQRTEAQTSTSATTPSATTPAAEIERAPVDPTIQSGARETQRGVEDAIKGRLEQIMEGTTGGSAPRRGLGGGSLEGEQFVNKRTGRGRRTAQNDDGADKSQMLARADGQTGTSEVQNAAEQSIQLAGKRTGSGTRIGLGDDTPIPGMPETEFA